MGTNNIGLGIFSLVVASFFLVVALDSRIEPRSLFLTLCRAVLVICSTMLIVGSMMNFGLIP